jgi:type II secretory pathway component PulM
VLRILDFLNASPARIQAVVIGAGAIVILCLGLLAYGLYERSQAATARGELEVARAQQAVLARSVEACSAAAAQAKRVGDQVVGAVRAHLEAARQATAGAAAQVDRLEQHLAAPTPAGAGCDDAWRVIELEVRR